jgi:peptidoglycan/LPS O-acetylase OafA/YrhL
MAFVVVALTASAYAGVILYKLVERPLLQWMSGKKRGHAKPAIAPALSQAKLPGSSR